MVSSARIDVDWIIGLGTRTNNEMNFSTVISCMSRSGHQDQRDAIGLGDMCLWHTGFATGAGGTKVTIITRRGTRVTWSR